MMKCWFTPGALRDREYSSPPIAQNVSTLIANEALAIIDYQQAKEEFRDDWMRQSKFIKNWTPKRCKAFAAKMRKATRMGLKQKQDFGHHMIRIAEMSDIIQTRVAVVKRKSWKRSKRLYVEFTATILRELHKRHKLLETATLLYRPMITPPVEHAVERSGGYIHHWIRKEMVQRYASNYIQPDQKRVQKFSEPSQLVIEGLNAMMNTEWAINERVLEVMNNLFKNNTNLANLPLYGFEEFMYTEDYPKDKPKEDQAKWCQRREEAWGDWYKQEQARGRMLVRLELAQDMVKHGFFFMPYTLDFRGRAYTTCELLSCQGSDFDKGLVWFANAVPQTAEGRDWLKVHIANLFDQDKGSFKDRIKWVDDNWGMLLSISEDPYGNREWIDDSVKKNKSFQRLLAIFDFTRTDGLTQCPIQMDGACNGSQHWSAIMKDPVVAKLTNVAPSEIPEDLYQYIANKVTDCCLNDPDNEWYKIFLDHWDNAIDRKVTKRPTMCDAYGLTFYGIQKYIKIEGHVDWLDSDKKGAGIVELARAIQDGLESTLIEPNKGKEYLKTISNISSNVNRHLTYTVPSGFKVVHYYNQIGKRRSLASLFNHKELVFYTFNTDVNPKTSEQGIPPNFIHSLDASHMFCTIWRMILEGITSFSMIHDSYGCHAPYVSTMRELIKEEFYEMHKENLLEKFKEDVEDYLGIELPSVPMQGTFELSRVLESDYFFA